MIVKKIKSLRDRMIENFEVMSGLKWFKYQNSRIKS